METNEQTIHVYVNSGDFVRCNKCQMLMLIPYYADKCPKCDTDWSLSWVNDDHCEQDVEALIKDGYQIYSESSLLSERFMSVETLEMEKIQTGEKPDLITIDTVRPRYCIYARHFVMMNYEGKGEWLCMHHDIGTNKDNKAADEAEVEEWKNENKNSKTNEEILCCSECGSTDVLMHAWVEPNNNDTFDSYVSFEQEDCYCNNCEEHHILATKTELLKTTNE